MKKVRSLKSSINICIQCFIKIISPGIIAWAFCFSCLGQYFPNKNTWEKLISIENDTSLSYNERLAKLFVLKKQFEESKLVIDSVYARILHRIGLYEYKKNYDIATKNAIIFTQAAIRINSSGKQNSSPALCVNSYANLGNCYKSLHLYNVALQYYDSSLLYRKKHFVPNITTTLLQLAKAQMLYRTGDYQKAIEELNIAIQKAIADKDSTIMPPLLNQRSQSYIMTGQLDKALKDVDRAANLSQIFDDTNEILNGMLLKGDILAKKKDFSKALLLYNQAIKQRIRTSNYSQISDDYTDLGNIYLDGLLDYAKAKECYLKTIRYALKAQDFERLAKGHINLEQCSFRQQNFKEAENFCVEALKDLKVTASNDILNSISLSSLSAVGNNELILVILRNKTEVLLTQFILTKNRNYLSACLQTAMVTDSLITNIRHQQLGEQSKLYWRTWTREFFTHTIEACYLANNTRLAFYFMEKSRAVLLNDKMNELGALAQLPTTEAAKERELQISVISEQLKKGSFPANNEAEYEAQQANLLQAKDNLEHYIKSLERKYPAYYQYKYDDEVSTLHVLQAELFKKKQSFVHYFINDTVAYILGVTPFNTKLIKLSKDNFNSSQLINFLSKCSYEPASNNDYLSFVSLSHSLYKLLFEPLNLPKGRVIICLDNFLIPFDALCSDNAGNNFLINDYIFSYVYSARYLLKKYNSSQPHGDFIGFAPVSFNAWSSIANLKHSGDALQQSAKHYSNSKLLTNNKASRHNFMSAVSDYTIVNVFSHALADTTEREPVLYMYDSIIRLSDLQLLDNPATQLVVLSACQTNVGRSAKGEGILSLARGFASAGIPSVAATLWQADEQMVYAISEKFHEYLSQGMAKDEALQKAKLYFIKNGEVENPFPYYWANMILVGNEEPINLSQNHHIFWWMLGITIIAAGILILVKFFQTNKTGSKIQ